MNRIYKLTFLFSLLLIATTISAQYYDFPRFQAGLKGGLNLNSASMDVSDYVDKKLNVSYKVGLFAEYGFTDIFYLQTGAYLNNKGVVLKKEDGLSSTGKTTWKQSVHLQYIQVPLLASFKLVLQTDARLFFNIGPYFSYGIGGKTTTTNDYSDSDIEDTKHKVDSFGKNRLKKTDYGLIFGSGIELEKFIFGMDVDFGFVNIREKNNELNPLFEDKGFKNKGVTFAVGYKF